IVDFRTNYQSLDVFLKTLFIRDAYYNPKAPFNSEFLYTFLTIVAKAIVLGSAVFLTKLRQKYLWELLAIWMVALFLLQDRTATYAQILWIYPAFALYGTTLKRELKITFLILLFLVCNFPYKVLEELPIWIRFMRLWLSIALVILFYLSITKKFNFTYIGIALLFLFLLSIPGYNQSEQINTSYVIGEKKHFMIADFEEVNGMLVYTALGRNGLERIKTDIKVDSFDTESCRIEDNQIYINGKSIIKTKSKKKKPVVVNECELYFLSDLRSRRGAFTLKKYNICSNDKL
ncbi:MAG: hypothetical protein AB3N14_14375, partial [Flavobacteriaceae bacterium]